MLSIHVKRAFTLVELLVVIAIIALLISILLPSLTEAREQGKKAVCLANLRSIAQASQSYATEDEREQIIPLGIPHVRSWPSSRIPGEWGWRTCEPYSFGGRSATKPFPIGGTAVKDLMDMTEEPEGKAAWQAFKRPLNRYIYGDVDLADMKDLKMFCCPSDAGYPDNRKWIEDCPPSAFGVRLYDMLGNSYRLNTCGMAWGDGSGAFSVGAWGHMASMIGSTSRVVLYSEPLFYNFSRLGADSDPTRLPIAGWHRRLMTDNVAFVDGSVRTTKVGKLVDFAPLVDDMNIYTGGGSNWSWWLRRGETWQTDCYPAPGAKINKYNRTNRSVTGDCPTAARWPFDNYRENQAPH